MPILSAEQANEAATRILAMPPDAVVEFFQEHRLRMAGKNPFAYIYGDPHQTPHKDDPEMAAASSPNHSPFETRAPDSSWSALIWL